MKKRILTVLLLLAMTTLLAVYAGAASVLSEGQAGDDLYFTLYDDGRLVFSGSGDMWDFDPNADHVGADGRAPWEGGTVTSLDFGDSEITYIGSSAFRDMGGLTGSLNLPGSVGAIGDFAFAGAGFDGTLTLNDGLGHIGFSAFEGVPFTGSLVIPDSVGYIGPCAFRAGVEVFSEEYDHFWETYWDDEAQEERPVSVEDRTYADSEIIRGTFTGTLTIGAGVDRIGWQAFAGQPFTGDLEIPGSVRVIEWGAFLGNVWDSATDPVVHVNRDGEGNFRGYYVDTRPLHSFDGESLILNEGLEVVQGAAFQGTGFRGDLLIPSTVIRLEDSAFHGHWYDFEDPDQGQYCRGTFDGRLIFAPGSQLEHIGGHCFKGQPFTGDLVIPDTVTEIGNWAFQWTGFDGSLTIGSGIREIPHGLFADTKFTGSLTIRAQLERISDQAFSGAGFTGTLTIPDTVTYIGDGAFAGAHFTGSLVIPDSVTYIGNDAFSAEWKEFGDVYFHEWEGVDPNWDRDYRWHRDSNPLLGTFDGRLTIGKNVEYIGGNAFRGQPFKGDLVIPDSVKEVQWSAFEAFVWDGTDETVHQREDGSWYSDSFYSGAFEGGTLTLGKNLETIGNGAFAGVFFKGDLVIPDSVKMIDNGAFDGWYFEEGEGDDWHDWWEGGFDGTLTLGKNVEFIGDSAFRGTKFKGSLVIPDSVTEMYDWAFQWTAFDGDLVIGDGLEFIPRGLVDGASFRGSLSIGDGVTRIENEAFRDTGFTGTLTLGNSVEYIGYDAFNGVPFTGSLVIPDSVTEIGDRAFRSVMVEYGEPFFHHWEERDPEWAEDEDYRFRQDAAPVMGTFDGTLTIGKNVEYIGGEAFQGQPFKGDLVIPDSVKEIQWSAFCSDVWDGTDESVHHNEDDDTWHCVTVYNGAFEGGTLTLGKNLETIGDNAFGAILFKGDLVIPDSVTYIGNNAFSGMWHEEGEGDDWHDWCAGGFDGTLTLGKNVQFIGDHAFCGTKFKGDLVIPDSVTEMYDWAFQWTAFDGDLVIGSGLEEIPRGAFDRTHFTGSLTIKPGLTNIGGGAFAGIPFAGSLTIPGTVKGIDSDAFRDTGFTGTLTLGEGIEYIGYDAFNGVPFTGSLVIPDSVTFIGDRAFRARMVEYGEPFLHHWEERDPEWAEDEDYRFRQDAAPVMGTFDGTLTIGKNVEYIGGEAFQGQPFKGDLVIPDSVKEIQWSAFCSDVWDGTDESVHHNEDDDTWYCVTVYNGAFEGGTLTLGKNLETIGDSAFYAVLFKGSLAIPDSVTIIERNAFSGMWHEEGEGDDWHDWCAGGFDGTLTLGKNVGIIGDRAFCGTKFKGDLVIPDSVTEMYDCAFQETAFDGNLVIGSGLEEIPHGAFDRTRFTGSLTIKPGLTNIGDHAFAGIPFAGSLTIPGTVEGIDNGAFADTGFTGTLTLGEGIEYIGYDAFAGVPFTGNLVIPDSVTVIEDRAFQTRWQEYGEPYDHTWETYWDEEAEEERPRPEEERIRRDAAPLMGTFDGTLTLGKNLKRIGYDAFYGQPFTGDLVIPDSVEEIWDGAFNSDVWDGRDESVYQHLGDGRWDTIRTCAYAFDGGTLTIGSGVELIRNGTFFKTGFSTVVIPDNVKEIGQDAFSVGFHFKEIVTEPNGDQWEWHEPNEGKLTSLTLGSGLKVIGDDAFRCQAIDGTLVIPASVEHIGICAFENCGNLDKLIFEGQVNNWEPCDEGGYGRNEFRQFDSCGELREIEFYGNMPENAKNRRIFGDPNWFNGSGKFISFKAGTNWEFPYWNETGDGYRTQVISERGFRTLEEAADSIGTAPITDYIYLEGSEGFDGENGGNLFDGDLESKLCTNMDDISVTVRTADGKAYHVNGVILATANDTAEFGRLPAWWALYGSADDGETWDEIYAGDASFFEWTNYLYYAASVPETQKAYSMFRFRAAIADEVDYTFQLSEIALCTADEITVLESYQPADDYVRLVDGDEYSPSFIGLPDGVTVISVTIPYDMVTYNAETNTIRAENMSRTGNITFYFSDGRKAVLTVETVSTWQNFSGFYRIVDGTLYEIHLGGSRLDDAESYADFHGGRLIEIDSAEKQAIVDEMLGEYRPGEHEGVVWFWIGSQPDGRIPPEGDGLIRQLNQEEGRWEYGSMNTGEPIGFIVEYPHYSEGWSGKVTGADGREYALFPSGLNWRTAVQEARNMGGHLATISSEEELNDILKLVPFSGGEDEALQRFWLGANCGNESGKCTWITGEAFGFLNWEENEPDGDPYGDGECLMIDLRTGQWCVECDDPWNAAGFIIEWEPAVDGADVIKDAELYLTFEGDLTDKTGKHTVTAEGEPEYTEGRNGQAIALRSEESWLHVDDLSFGTDSFTIAAWVNVRHHEGDPAFFSNKDWHDGNNPGFVLCVRDGDWKYNAKVPDGDRTDWEYPFHFAGYDSVVNEWVHIAISVDREAETYLFYVNGQPVDVPNNFSENGHEGIPYDVLPFTIGQDGTGTYDLGRMACDYDDVAVFKRALSENEISAIADYTAPTAIRGDVDDSGQVDSDDAIYLLRHTLNRTRYPINQDGNMDGIGETDSDDAIYLLRHTLNKARYPLKNAGYGN